jgi:hypothetical protein
LAADELEVRDTENFMATYIIIGGNQKEYGPITGSDVRQWISEGRLNEQSPAKAEGETVWRPLATFPEFADLFTAQAPAASAAAGMAMPADWAERDYELDIGSCLSRGWALVKNNFWPTVGVTTLVMLLVIAANQILGLFSRSPINDMMVKHQFSAGGIAIVVLVSVVGAPIYTIFTAGLFKYYLKLIRGEPAGVGDAFSGFGPHLGQLVLLSLVQIVLLLVGYALCFLPGIYLAVAWYFAIPLVVDKGLGFWEAMQLSRKLVNKHWFLVFAFLLVYSLVMMSGMIACCIGIFVTMPIGFAAMMYAYETIFSESKAP